MTTHPNGSVQLTEEALKALIQTTVETVLDNIRTQHLLGDMDAEAHRKQHECFQQFMEVANRLNEIKYDVIKYLVQAGVIGILSLLAYAIYHKVKT
jgi:hypothetical protein